jgi:dihydroorotate dehydrogenase (NAD+) catalytic subunit
MGADPAETAALLDAVRPLTDKPLIVKLTPNTASPADVAAAAEAHGADAVSLINTLRGTAMHPTRRTNPPTPWLGGGTGGVSGPAVRAMALVQVAEVTARVAIPVVGMGGVQSGGHARDLLDAGATLVGVGTESFRDPLAGARIAEELAATTTSDRAVAGASRG